MDTNDDSVSYASHLMNSDLSPGAAQEIISHVNILLRFVTNMDAVGVKMAQSLLPENLWHCLNVSRFGRHYAISLRSTALRSREDNSRLLSDIDQFVNFTSDLISKCDIDLKQRDGEGLTIIHHALRNLIHDECVEYGSGWRFLTEMFYDRNSRTGAYAFNDTENEYKQNALAYALSQSLKETWCTEALGPNTCIKLLCSLVSKPADAGGNYNSFADGEIDIDAATAPDAFGYSTAEYLACQCNKGVDKLMAAYNVNGVSARCSLANLAQLMTTRKTISWATLRNLKAAAHAGFDTAPDAGGRVAGDYFFDTMTSQLKIIESRVAQERVSAGLGGARKIGGRAVLDRPVSAKEYKLWHGHSNALEDSVNCFFFLLDEHPDLCSAVTGESRADILSLISRTEMYADQSRESLNKVKERLLSGIINDKLPPEEPAAYAAVITI